MHEHVTCPATGKSWWAPLKITGAPGTFQIAWFRCTACKLQPCQHAAWWRKPDGTIIRLEQLMQEQRV